jgi:LmbE family N-acetylglucosaminyl deacetylase
MRVLAVAAHPDDEILGCGGILARHADAGDDVHVLIVAEGATSRDDRRDAAGRCDEMAGLRQAARAAAGVLGAHPPVFLGLPDNRLDQLALLDVVKAIEAVVAPLAPAVVYTHHGGDLNIDHRIVHQATLTACRPLPGSSVEAIFAFETLSSTEWASPASGDAFRPTRFVDISGQLERKLKALRCYAGEMRAFPHARSEDAIEALARVRGSSAGIEAAEALAVIRQVVKIGAKP